MKTIKKQYDILQLVLAFCFGILSLTSLLIYLIVANANGIFEWYEINSFIVFILSFIFMWVTIIIIQTEDEER